MQMQTYGQEWGGVMIEQMNKMIWRSNEEVEQDGGACRTASQQWPCGRKVEVAKTRSRNKFDLWGRVKWINEPIELNYDDDDDPGEQTVYE